MATLRVPQPPPPPIEDAEHLRKAFEGWGTDEKTVIAILAHRDAVQRREIMLAYEDLYGEDFIERLQKELASDLERAVYYWMFDPTERGSVMANEALKKSVDCPVIVEIACVSSPSELWEIRKAYHARYKKSLEEDVASHTTGDLRKLLVALVSAYRFEGQEASDSLAQLEAKTLHESILALDVADGGVLEQSDAKILREAIEQRIFHRDEIIRILSTRSKAQLNATFNRYKGEYGNSIVKDLASRASSSGLTPALRAAVRCIARPQKYYEKALRRAMDKAGTDEDAVTRVVVTRAEKDLKEIKEMYQNRTNVALGHALGRETSGYYKDFLLALIGE